MAVRKIFGANPPYELELISHSLIGDVIARIDVNDDNVIEGFISFLDSSGGWDDHLLSLLRAAGRTEITSRLQALIFMQNTPRAEFVAMCKPAWNEILKLVSDLVNANRTGAASTPPAPVGGAFMSAEEAFGGLLSLTVHTDGPDGKATLSIP